MSVRILILILKYIYIYRQNVRIHFSRTIRVRCCLLLFGSRCIFSTEPCTQAIVGLPAREKQHANEKRNDSQSRIRRGCSTGTIASAGKGARAGRGCIAASAPAVVRGPYMHRAVQPIWIPLSDAENRLHLAQTSRLLPPETAQAVFRLTAHSNNTMFELLSSTLVSYRYAHEVLASVDRLSIRCRHTAARARGIIAKKYRAYLVKKDKNAAFSSHNPNLGHNDAATAVASRPPKADRAQQPPSL